jgi:hypothetical protein
MTDRRALMPHANKEQMSNYRIRWTDGHDREYKRIENYPPYQHMDDAVCFAKNL